MSILKADLVNKFKKGVMISTTENVLIGDHETEYTTTGESFVVVKTHKECVVTLDSKTTENVTIKAITKAVVKPDVNKIDEKYDEILLENGVSVTFIYAAGIWYIAGSDGFKD